MSGVVGQVVDNETAAPKLDATQLSGLHAAVAATIEGGLQNAVPMTAAAAGLGDAGAAGYAIAEGLGVRDADLARQLQEHFTAGGPAATIGSRSALAQRAMREMPADVKATWGKRKNPEKQEYRDSWAQLKVGQLLTTRTQVKEWRKVERTHGEYMSATRYFQAEGGEPEDVEPTLTAPSVSRSTVGGCVGGWGLGGVGGVGGAG